MNELRQLCKKMLDDSSDRENLDTGSDGAVLTHCNLLGYGAVMDAAARLWRRRDPVGALVVGPCIGTLEALMRQPDEEYRLLEIVADIAFLAGATGFNTGDSRADVEMFIGWAREFEADNHLREAWDDYCDDIQVFAAEKMRGVEQEDDDATVRLTWVANITGKLSDFTARREGVRYMLGPPADNDTGDREAAGVSGVYVPMPLDCYLSLPEIKTDAK